MNVGGKSRIGRLLRRRAAKGLTKSFDRRVSAVKVFRGLTERVIGGADLLLRQHNARRLSPAACHSTGTRTRVMLRLRINVIYVIASFTRG